MDHNGGGGAAGAAITTTASEAVSSSWKKAFYMVSIVLIIIVVGVVVVAVLFLIPTDEKDTNAFESQTNIPSNIPAVTPQPSPIPWPTTIPTPGPTTTPTLAPIPTLTTTTPTPHPISSPNPEPSPRPTSTPTPDPTPQPTPTPTPDPTPRPTSVPTPDPTPQPTVEPTTSNPTRSLNLGVCIVCPDDEQVTNPDIFVQITSPDGLETTSIRCSELQDLGRQGLIPVDDCDDAQNIARFICGCGTPNATPVTTVIPTPRPTPSPRPPFADLGPLLDDPVIIWTNVVQAGIMKGNGAFLTPGQQHIITTSGDGTVTSFDAASGTVVWDYQPPAVGTAVITCHSNMVFTTPNAATPYMVYSVVDNENYADPTTRVIALDMRGTSLWTSGPLEGVAAGSPVISDDGRYVFLTHNAAFKTRGYFTALFAAQGGVTFYSMSNDTAPFSEPGIFHSPIEGYYDGLNGVDNQNDVILWANAVPSYATAIGLGSTFVFQFPVGFVDTTDNVGYLLLRGEPFDFLAEASPVITNSGRSAYWAVSRSEFLAWVGTGLVRDNFSQGPAGKNSGEVNADFRGTPVFASIALSSSTTEPFVFGGTAAPEFVRFNSDLSLKTSQTVDNLILAEAKVDPEDRVVYYVEESGLLHQADFDDIEDEWTVEMGVAVMGELALTSDGTFLYVTNIMGNITALQVGEVPTTSAPSSSPSANATESPSSAPSVPTTPAPITSAPVTPAPVTDAPVTDPPVEMPITEPPVETSSPTPGPVVDPTPSPTPGPTAGESPAPSSPDVTNPPSPSPGDSGSNVVKSSFSFAFVLAVCFCMFY